MALTPNQIASIRREVGALPDDAALNLIFDRVGDSGLVILEIVETRLAELLSEPASFSVSGEYAQSTEQNIIGLREQLKRLRGLIDDPDNVLGGGVKIIYATHGPR